MKKLILITLFAGILIGCAKQSEDYSSNTDTKESKPVQQNKVLTTDQILQKFKDGGIVIPKSVTYTEETDLNNQLGRPNQYIAKVNWVDGSVQQPNIDVMIGGTVEIFTNLEDLKRRKEYVEEITKNMPIVNQYIYAKDVYLLRLDKELTPTQAKKYDEIFQKL